MLGVEVVVFISHESLKLITDHPVSVVISVEVNALRLLIAILVEPGKAAATAAQAQREKNLVD